MRTSPTFVTRSLAAAVMATGLAFAATAAHAYKPYIPPSLPYLKSNLVQVDVYNRTTGLPLSIYPNDNRNWIEGVPGHEYAVRIRNTTGARILVVTSVDGVNVISGDTASPSQSGYVLDAYGSVEIQGWRKSMTRTAAFYFTDLGDSYAARTGRPQNVGVIGVAVFQEKAKARIAYNEWDWRSRSARKDEAESRASATAEAKERAEAGAAAPPPPPLAQPAPAAPYTENSASEPAQSRADASAPARDAQRHQPMEAAKPQTLGKLGTGHGRNEESRVTMTNFERATTYPAETLSVQYDRRENLVAMGVLPQPIPPIARREPNPFPGVRFAPDPR